MIGRGCGAGGSGGGCGGKDRSVGYGSKGHCDRQSTQDENDYGFLCCIFLQNLLS